MSTISSTGSSSLSSTLAVSGLASGMDWQTVVTELANAERFAETPWKTQQTSLSSQNATFASIKNNLTTLQADVKALQDPTLFEGALAQSSDSSIALASADPGAALGTFIFKISQLATAAQINGRNNVSQILAPSGDPADVTIGSAAFGTAVTAGTFTINGSQIKVAATDTLQDVFDKIDTATGHAVSAHYDAATDTINLTSNGEIILGSATDTSNFLQVSQLFNNNETAGIGSYAIASAQALGTVQLSTSMANAHLGATINTGTFSVNGSSVTVAGTDTLQNIFDKIATATNGAVTAGYDSGTGKITLSSSNAIVLGGSGDTSNFLNLAGLQDNGTGTVAGNPLGKLSLTTPISSYPLSQTITNGGSGPGAFIINGVTINYNASSDSIQNVLDRITSSAAGVTASYDSLNRRFVLTDKNTGDMGVSLKDVTGNFLAATGLAGGTLQHGQNLLYTLNGSTQQLVSQSNTITSASSNITGLSVTALQNKTVTVTVNGDTSKISSTIQQFITDYNSVQSTISAQQIVTTGSDGKVTPGTLTGDQTANSIASGLRSAVFSPLSGLSGVIQMLASLGIQTNGQDNTLTLKDPNALNNALANNLNDVKSFFSDATNGWATQLNKFLNNTIGDNGTLINHQTNLTQQSDNINTQIANLEKKITSDSAQWTAEFQAMETAQAKVNQELTYLSQAVSSGSL